MSNGIKIDLHVHTKGDPLDRFIEYTPRQLVELALAKGRGYGALAITHHTRVFYDTELDKFASDQGLILIPGMEANVNRRHVLLYCPKDKSAIDELNAASRQSNGNMTFDKVRDMKKQGIVELVGGAHPYYLAPVCLGDDLVDNADLFDFAELSWYHTGFTVRDSLAWLNPLNRNQKAQLVAERLQIPMVATSDTHYLENFGKAYSFVDSDNDLESIVKALKSRVQSKITPISPPIGLWEYAKVFHWIAGSHISSFFR